MYKKRNNSTDASRTAWRRRRSTQAAQQKATEHILGGSLPVLVPQVPISLRSLTVMQ